MDLSKLIEEWENSALDLRSAERLINLLIIDNKRLELKIDKLHTKPSFDVVELLNETVRSARMEKASFGWPNDVVEAKNTMELNTTCHPTAYIKDKTKLYRETWIVSPILRVIKHLQNTDA